MTIRVGSKYQHLAGRAACACHSPAIQALTHRVNADLTRRGLLSGMAASLAVLCVPEAVQAQAEPAPAEPPGPVLLTNLRLFDGTGTALRNGVQVLVDGDPTEDLAILAEPDRSLRLIMKDGRIHKNTLAPDLP